MHVSAGTSRSVESPGATVTGSYVLPDWHVENCPGPLEEQYVLLTAKTFLQPHITYLSILL